MILSDLLKEIHVRSIAGTTDVSVAGVAINSRAVQPGYAFIALRGTQTDGHKYIKSAEEAGAAVVVCEDMPQEASPAVTYVQVASTIDVAGPIASAFYGHPSRRLRLVGVTGTNGKTTIATLLYQMFSKMGHRCGLLSTVCNYVVDEPSPADHTTPDVIALNELLARMVAAGCDYAFMECSSHAVDQKRIAGLTYAGGIFTNLTRDHLDYHKTFENYRDAKKAFFDMLPEEAFVVTNADDRNGLFMTQNTAAAVKTYSVRGAADYKGRIIEAHFEGMYLAIDGREVGVQFIGKFNVSNLLAVYGAACMLGKAPDEVLLVLSTLRSVSGRLEPIRSPRGFTALVDYAHTPDALENVLTAIHEVLQGRGRVITVCGAGGNRDKGKRPLMAQEAARQSNQVIITSDNPRYEEPDAIIADMLAGLDDEQRKSVVSITDRRQAIKAACAMAQPGDVILIAGKGHEDYQEVCGVKHHFDDREEVRRCFE